MTNERGVDALGNLMGLLFKAHPWHGLSAGKDAPEIVTAFIEIVPTDTVKYEIDKISGYLKVDRPQQYSNALPALYGLVPRTLCGENVAALMAQHAGRDGLIGDGDPLDICVLSERPILHGDVLVPAIPIGGLRVIDRNEADDKIIAVMKDDLVYGTWRDISECPHDVLERLKHYFLTYKEAPGSTERRIELVGVYGREEAHDVIRRSQSDYHARFAGLYSLLERTSS